MRTAVRVAGLVLLTIFGSIAVSGVQLAFAVMPPMIGTAYEMALTALVFYLWRLRLGAKFRHAPTHRIASARLVIACALSASAVSGAQQYWYSSNPVSFLDGTNVSPWVGASGLVLALVTAPLLEEALFRGFLLPRLRECLTPITAAAVSAAAFAVAHDEPSQGIGRFVAGMLLAMIVIRTGRLWLAVLAHSATNLFGVLVGGAKALLLPERMGLLYPAVWLIIATIAALEVRKVLMQTQWDTARNALRGVTPPVTWNPDPIH